MVILTADEIRRVEEKCFELYSSEAELMLRAGTACFKAMTSEYDMKNKTACIFCGNGKNAGDGFVIARLLYSEGVNAKIVLCDKVPTIDEPLMYFNKAVNSGVEVVQFSQECINADFIIDCMFGIGFRGQPRAPFDEIFAAISKSDATIIAVDTPSGTDSTDASVCEDCVCADYTIAISTFKYAHILPPSNEYCGRIDVVDIGIPQDCYEDDYAQTIDYDMVKSLFPKRKKNDNKGTYGRQLNICSSYKMPGAAVLATRAALRTGVGLVKLATPESAYPIIASHLVEPVFCPVCENECGTFSKNATKQLEKELLWADSVVIGCGMGCNDDTAEVLKFVLKNAKSPVIVDADGINCLNMSISILKEIKETVVLTPHPGEMARLTSKTVAEIQSDRINVAKAFAAESSSVVVLKGANTVVTDGDKVFVNTTGNPSMAMGGSGDMLSGMIGSFVAQGISALNAALAAVYIHGLCGDITAEGLSLRGITVSDMIEQLGSLMSEFE